MRKIRIGKDISGRWPILTNGKPESLDNITTEVSNVVVADQTISDTE